MAKAIANTRTETTVIPTGVTLTLTPEEARALHVLTAFVSGPFDGPRGDVAAIGDALDEALKVRYHAHPEYQIVRRTGGIAFGDVPA